MALPNFIGIGTQRAGTTWLYEMLSLHPDIFLPAQKELHFFDEKPDFSAYEGLGNPGQRPYYDMGSADHWNWYREQFEPGLKHKVRGEITPFYATLSDKRVALMAEKLPALKIIYIIRNPVKRAWSGFRLFWFLETGHKECEPAEDIIRKTVMYPAKLIHGDYRRNTRVYENNFKRDRILYLFYDDIIQSPDEFLKQVFSFLEIEPLPLTGAELKKKVNAAPDAAMPMSVEKALADHYADQIDFIRSKFDRELVY